jgi:transcriptional regulator
MTAHASRLSTVDCKPQHLDLRHVLELYVEARGVPVSVKSDLPQGTLDLLILKVLVLGPLHGYAVGQRLQQISRDVVQVTQGTLYPALHRLENRGLLVAEWKMSDTGREAKFYRLTRKGRVYMEAETRSWLRLTDAIGLIFKSAEESAS